MWRAVSAAVLAVLLATGTASGSVVAVSPVPAEDPAGIIFQDGFQSGNFAAWSAAFPPSCTDGLPNGNETGVDCGGGTCPACPDGQPCNVDGDCLLNSCWLGVCQPSSCPAFCTTDEDCQAPGCFTTVCMTQFGVCI